MAYEYELKSKNLTLDFILQKIYFSEYEVIDGINQHKDGRNFYEWLFDNRLINEFELKRIDKLIEEENDED